MLVIYGFSILLAIVSAAPVRYGQNDAAPSTGEETITTTPGASSKPSHHRRHFPILHALYQTFEAYDLTLDSTYEAEYDQLKDGSGWPFAAGSGALMYVEQVSESKVRKRGRDWIIEEPVMYGSQYRGAGELSEDEDEPVFV